MAEKKLKNTPMPDDKKITIEKVKDGFRVEFHSPAVFGTATASIFSKDWEHVIGIIKDKRSFFNQQ
jgi:hypothetical protein